MFTTGCFVWSTPALLQHAEQAKGARKPPRLGLWWGADPPGATTADEQARSRLYGARGGRAFPHGLWGKKRGKNRGEKNGAADSLSPLLQHRGKAGGRRQGGRSPKPREPRGRPEGLREAEASRAGTKRAEPGQGQPGRARGSRAGASRPPPGLSLPPCPTMQRAARLTWRPGRTEPLPSGPPAAGAGHGGGAAPAPLGPQPGTGPRGAGRGLPPPG